MTYRDKYISEYGFTQPEEGLRTDLFRVLDESDRTSTRSLTLISEIPVLTFICILHRLLHDLYW